MDVNDSPISAYYIFDKNLLLKVILQKDWRGGFRLHID